MPALNVIGAARLERRWLSETTRFALPWTSGSARVS